MPSFGGIFLPHTCKIDYVNIQDNYVNMQDNYAFMQDNYVDMQDYYVGMQVTNLYRESDFNRGKMTN